MRPLTLPLAEWLTTPEAETGMAYAATLPLDERQTLATLTLLQKAYPQEQSAALLDQARLRERARAKFGDAATQMLFTDDALQQASGNTIARYRAQRYAPFGAVADLGCGIGGDALALSQVVPRLHALDLDPIRLTLARHNLEQVGGEAHTTLVEADWTRYAFPSDLRAAFADPARRDGEKRIFSLHNMIPPIEAVLAARQNLPDMGVKVMPGVADEEIPTEAETEWISEGGTAKEGVLWFGALRPGAARIATLIEGAQFHTLSSADPPAALTVTPPRAYLYEPDPAVIRATLVAQAALSLGASQVDSQIAYLTGDSPALSPFVRGWQVLTHAPFNLKALNRMIRELGGNVVAVKKRGSPIEPEPFRKRLKSDPQGRPLTVFLTRHADQPYMILCGAELRAPH